jgi:hypothetical protein
VLRWSNTCNTRTRPPLYSRSCTVAPRAQLRPAALVSGLLWVDVGCGSRIGEVGRVGEVEPAIAAVGRIGIRRGANPGASAGASCVLAQRAVGLAEGWRRASAQDVVAHASSSAARLAGFPPLSERSTPVRPRRERLSRGVGVDRAHGSRAALDTECPGVRLGNSTAVRLPSVPVR